MTIVLNLLMLIALPAFAFGAIAVRGLAHLAASEVCSFAVVMPRLVFAWSYFVGGLIDRWVRKRSPVRELPVTGQQEVTGLLPVGRQLVQNRRILLAAANGEIRSPHVRVHVVGRYLA